jgi:hypothetical protein
MHHKSGVFAAPFWFAVGASDIREKKDDGQITSNWSGSRQSRSQQDYDMAATAN